MVVRSHLTLEERRGKMHSLKAKSNCRRCGAIGHWAGHPELGMFQDRVTQALAPGERVNATALHGWLREAITTVMDQRPSSSWRFVPTALVAKGRSATHRGKGKGKRQSETPLNHGQRADAPQHFNISDPKGLIPLAANRPWRMSAPRKGKRTKTYSSPPSIRTASPAALQTAEALVIQLLRESLSSSPRAAGG